MNKPLAVRIASEAIVIVDLPSWARDGIREQAAFRRTSEAGLIGQLLSRIVQGDLYPAVLDSGGPF